MVSNKTCSYRQRSPISKLWLRALLLFLTFSGAALATQDIEHAAGIVGILPLPEVFGHEPCEHFQAQEIALYSSPDTPQPIGRIYLARPYSFPPEGGCAGLEVAVSLFPPQARNERLPTLEFSYENPGAIVVRREGAWFRIALTQGYGWVHVENPARYLPVELLLKDSLTHLQQHSATLVRTPASDEVIWRSPVNAQPHLPVEVLELRKLDGVLWVQLKLLAVEPCTDEKSGVAPATGWLPFHGSGGLPSVWFSSRGC